MKILLTIITMALAHFLIGQRNNITLYIGGNVPTEVALLDLSGNGPDDVFRPGVVAGFSLERNWRRIGLRGDLDLGTNGLKDEDGGYTGTLFNGRLYNLYGRSYFNFNIENREEKSVLAFGIGPGVIVGSVPETRFYSDILGGGGNFTLERRTEISLALCTSIRVNLPIDDQVDFYLALNNDLIGYYADIESVIYTNLNIGFSFYW